MFFSYPRTTKFSVCFNCLHCPHLRLEDQMASSMCFFRNPLPWIAILVPFLVLAGSSGLGFLSIFLTSSVLILSTAFFTLMSRPSDPHVTEEALTSDQECATDGEVEQVVAKEGSIDHLILERNPLDSFSESDQSIDQFSTTEDSEVDWPCSGNVGLSPDCSDDSISDEESLIEIALPAGNFVGPIEKDLLKSHSLQKFPNLWSESLSRQTALMELLTEINEEENLIEIDISMGSIKCF